MLLPALPSVPSLSFQPTISKKSKALLQKKNRKAPTGSLRADGRGEIDADDVFFRLHKHLPVRGDNPSERDQADPVAASKRSTTPPVEWNVIAFDHTKHSFIIKNFDLKVSST